MLNGSSVEAMCRNIRNREANRRRDIPQQRQRSPEFHCAVCTPKLLLMMCCMFPRWQIVTEV